MADAPLLELRGVSLAFGGLKVVSGLDLQVREGEIVSVIGPNGAGKTTLFNLITGIYEPDDGDILFDGRSIVGLEPHQITQLGIARTFQTLRLFLNMSVRENVMAAAYGRTKAGVVRSMLRTPGMRREEAEIRQLAEEQLSFFGERLKGYRWDQPAYSLSYANRRRLEIARAMATGPKILLLDEPAAGMNPVETHEITELIARLRNEAGYTILVIEHDMHVVEGISDRVVALDHGVKIVEGIVRAGRDRPARHRGLPRHEGGGDQVSLLRLEGINTYYGQIHILQDLNLEVNEGELVCLLGGNASGKSTTLKTILGIVRSRSGRIEFNGEDVTTRSTSHRIGRGMAIVPENRRLFAPMTVQENLELGAYLHGGGTKEDYERVYELFPLVYDRRGQLAGTLSGGEQQMVAMARALMSRPKLMLMDEPSMGLAPILVERSFEIIKQVHESGVAVLVVEQNANVSLSIADRGYVLSTGPPRARGQGGRPAQRRGPAQGLPRPLSPAAERGQQFLAHPGRDVVGADPAGDRDRQCASARRRGCSRGSRRCGGRSSRARTA